MVMCIFLFLLWLILNGKVTLEICLFGIVVTGLVYAFCVAVLSGEVGLILDDQVAGFASIYNDQIKNISLDRKQLQKHLGFFMGLAAYKILKKEFEDKQYPFEMTPQMQAIEFVASNAQYRRKGVASEIIKHIIKEDHHTVFVLEVADTNTSAVSLYKKIGFKEFMKVKMKNSKQSGVDHLIYMAYQKKASTNPNGMIAP